MKFTDWFHKQLCTHTNENTGFSTFVLFETRPFRTKRVICSLCRLSIDVPEHSWEQWQRETKQTVTP